MNIEANQAKSWCYEKTKTWQTCDESKTRKEKGANGQYQDGVVRKYIKRGY